MQQGAAAPLRSGQRGRVPVAPAAGATGSLQRFADVDHHVIESAALERRCSRRNSSTPSRRNTHRDYSQLPAVANALLLGQKSSFGGYQRHEHFDNFVFDRAADRWVSQDEFDGIWDDQTPPLDRAQPGHPAAAWQTPCQTPLAYRRAELIAAVQRDSPDAGAFAHLGNALHDRGLLRALELRRTRAGRHVTSARNWPPIRRACTAELGGPRSSGASPTPGSAAFFNDRFAARGTASPSRTGGSRDFHGSRNHLLAMTLATLVIRQIGLMLREAFALRTRRQRKRSSATPSSPRCGATSGRRATRTAGGETMLSGDRGMMRGKIPQAAGGDAGDRQPESGRSVARGQATRFSSFKAFGMGTSLSFPDRRPKVLTIGHMLYPSGHRQRAGSDWAGAAALRVGPRRGRCASSPRPAVQRLVRRNKWVK